MPEVIQELHPDCNRINHDVKQAGGIIPYYRGQVSRKQERRNEYYSNRRN